MSAAGFFGQPSSPQTTAAKASATCEPVEQAQR